MNQRSKTNLGYQPAQKCVLGLIALALAILSIRYRVPLPVYLISCMMPDVTLAAAAVPCICQAGCQAVLMWVEKSQIGANLQFLLAAS